MWSRERVRRGQCVPRKGADAGRHVKRCRPRGVTPRTGRWRGVRGRRPEFDACSFSWAVRRGRSAVVPGPPVTHRASPRAVPRVVARLLAAPPAARSEKPLLGRRRPAGWGPRTGGDRRWLGGRGWGFGLRGGCGVGTASSFSSARGVLVPKSLPDQSSRWEILKEADYVRNHITALPVVMVIELFTPKKLM